MEKAQKPTIKSKDSVAKRRPAGEGSLAEHPGAPSHLE
jgi:hypothetical protein